MRYYFLLSYLPEIQIGKEPDIHFDDLKYLLDMNLTEKDLNRVKSLLTLIDLKNVCSVLKEEKVDPRGNFTEKEIDEGLLVQTNLPEFVFDYISEHVGKEESIRYFSEVYVRFFAEAVEKSEGFLLKYFQFEREFRLTLLALRAKQFKKDLSHELQFEDPTDPFVAHILSQKDMEGFDPPMEYQEVKSLFQENLDDPKDLAQKFLEYRYNKIEEMEKDKIFGIDQVLGYVARFLLVDYWHHLDEEEGKNNISKII